MACRVDRPDKSQRGCSKCGCYRNETGYTIVGRPPSDGWGKRIERRWGGDSGVSRHAPSFRCLRLRSSRGDLIDAPSPAAKVAGGMPPGIGEHVTFCSISAAPGPREQDGCWSSRVAYPRRCGALRRPQIVLYWNRIPHTIAMIVDGQGPHGRDGGANLADHVDC